MATKESIKQASKLDYKNVVFASLPFMGMISFWQVYDGLVPLILTNTFGMSDTLANVVMAVDNVFGLFLLPLFGILSDKCKSKLGRRTPFILVGSVIACVSIPLIAMADNIENFPLLIATILVTLLAICMYRTMTVAIIADITPRPLRTKADSIEKIVGYAGTGVMLVAIAVLVPDVEKPNYMPVFALQGAFIAVSAILYAWRVREPKLVEKMHEDSLAMGIEEEEIDLDDSPEAGGKEKIDDPSVRRSVLMLLGSTFFYYMAYNAMTTDISRYAEQFFSLGGGSYAIINIVTIIGALASYVPLANLSLRIGRKKLAMGCSVLMVACSAAIWLFPGFSPVLYLVFLVMGAALGGVDLCVYTMLVENCDSNSIGRYSGYYYTVSMAGQVATPIISGIVMDVAASQLFGYITLMSVFMLLCVLGTKHGDTILIDEVARREEEYATK